MQEVRKIRRESDAVCGDSDALCLENKMYFVCENQMHHGRRIRCTVCGESDAEVGEANRERLRAGQNDGCARD